MLGQLEPRRHRQPAIATGYLVPPPKLVARECFAIYDLAIFGNLDLTLERLAVRTNKLAGRMCKPSRFSTMTV